MTLNPDRSCSGVQEYGMVLDLKDMAVGFWEPVEVIGES